MITLPLWHRAIVAQTCIAISTLAILTTVIQITYAAPVNNSAEVTVKAVKPNPNNQTKANIDPSRMDVYSMVIAYRKPVRARDLMSKQERREYRLAMRAAQTPEAKQQIREITFTRLIARANAQGMVIVVEPRWAAVTRWQESSGKEPKPVTESANPQRKTNRAVEVVPVHTAAHPAPVHH
ncbi:hypothetical protein TI04_02245 [Achromatium sp. WMS2]|nr:hypothetical protein TI04_02245 [Achromatium sp. WMS2]